MRGLRPRNPNSSIRHCNSAASRQHSSAFLVPHTAASPLGPRNQPLRHKPSWVGSAVTAEQKNNYQIYCAASYRTVLIQFDRILDRVTGSEPSVTDYILES